MEMLTGRVELHERVGFFALVFELWVGSRAFCDPSPCPSLHSANRKRSAQNISRRILTVLRLVSHSFILGPAIKYTVQILPQMISRNHAGNFSRTVRPFIEQGTTGYGKWTFSRKMKPKLRWAVDATLALNLDPVKI